MIDPTQLPTSGNTATANNPLPAPDTTPTAPAATTTPAPAGASAASQPNAALTPSAQAQPGAKTPAAPVAPAQPASNTPSSSATVSNDPAIAHAKRTGGVIHALAQSLAGTTYTPNADGTVTAAPKPLSKGDLWTAIALSAISGSLAGLSQRGPGAEGRAAEAGFQQVSEQRQQADQQAQELAKFNSQQQAQSLARKASIFEANSRAILNTSEAEQMGADAIDKLAAINKASGVLDLDPSMLDNGGQPMTQDELLSAMKAGKLSPTDQLGPVAGRVEVTNPDGTKRWEATHLVILDPNTKVPVNQQQWDSYTAAGVPGWPKSNIGQTGAMLPLRLVQNANEIVAAHYLANQRLVGLRDVLDGTQFADKVPTSIDFTKPGVNTALERFQKYVSHDATNLADPYLALQEMGADKRNPQTGQMQPNPDAKYVSTVMDALGGPQLLLAAHNQMEAQKKVADQYAVIDSDDKANAVLAARKKFTPDQVSAAEAFKRLSAEQGAAKAAQDARARAVAEGTDVQAMYRFGRNPITGEQLSLENAPDSMLVNSQGQVIPQDLVSTYKPSQNEKQTADTARQVLAISDNLQKAVAKNPNLIGPLLGRSKQGLAKAGLGDAESQQLLDNLSFLQSAATKMHTGRFSNEILKKMGDLIKPGMNVDQFNGALASINDVAGRYAQEDRLVTVGELKNMQNNVQRVTNNINAGTTPQVIPAGGQPVSVNGKTTGYVLNGRYTAFGAQ